MGLEKERLGQYDECWPVRFATWKFGSGAAKEAEAVAVHNSVHFITPASPGKRALGCVGAGVCRLYKALACFLVCSGLYSAMCLSCCAPCLGKRPSPHPLFITRQTAFTSSTGKECTSAVNLKGALTGFRMLNHQLWGSLVDKIP